MTPGAAERLYDRLRGGGPLNVLFLNDVGFQYGAGIASLRQIQSFLLMGHTVTAMSCEQGPIEAGVPVVTPQSKGEWRGLKVMPHLHRNEGISEDCIVDALIFEIVSLDPDVVIVGNLHGANWPLRVLLGLRDQRLPLVAYMHDCYLLTGRCAYPGSCRLFEYGCNDTCPTWQQYPRLEPDQIAGEWRLRRELFCGSHGIPLAANSRWTLEMAKTALPGLWHADCVHYGLDERLFHPIDRRLARELLAIPEDEFVILTGAADAADHRKGSDVFREVVLRLRDDVRFVMFGLNSDGIEGVSGTGLLRDYRVLPLLYGAADVFVGASLEEAFGQTFCEAAACALPIVAFPVGGVPDIARHGHNARLAATISADGLIAEIEYLKANPDVRTTLGRAGRDLVEREFTLSIQGKRWMRYLTAVAELARS
jgi:glycosyltransferase involved in cell wall biosynthesis